jgi:hypothetical protein
MEADARMVNLADSLICDSVIETDTGIENLPIIENATDLISQKEVTVSRLTAQALNMQARFVWDLALAVKRMCIGENTSEQGRDVAISKIGVREIMVKLETEAPPPRKWMGWILQEFERGSVAEQ